MFKIDIKNVASQKITHSSQHGTLEESQEWLDRQLSKEPCPFGKPEHQVIVSEMEWDVETGEVIKEAEYETVPSEFEVIGPIDITAEVEAEAAKQRRIASGERDGKVSAKAMACIRGWNREVQLTAEQITQQTTTFAPIVNLLLIGRPDSAYAVISNIVPDGTIVSQEMKDEVLSILQEE